MTSKELKDIYRLVMWYESHLELLSMDQLIDMANEHPFPADLQNLRDEILAGP